MHTPSSRTSRRVVVALALLGGAVAASLTHPAAAAPPFTAGAAQNPYPRLTARASDLSLIRERLTREPYATLFARVLSRARATPTTAPTTDGDRARSQVARAAAFVFAMGAGRVPEMERAAMGAKAETLLVGIVAETGVTGFTTANETLIGAERLHPWAIAYDLLEGGGFAFTQRDAVREKLATLASNLYDDVSARYVEVFRSYNQNHTIKVASAVGLAAMVLDGYTPTAADPRASMKQPRDWMAWALDRVELLAIDALSTDTEGGYTEGPVYYWYAALQHVPFLRAWHLYGGEHGGFPFTARGGRPIGDLWTHNSFIQQQTWLRDIATPDGLLPPFNDSTPGVAYFYGFFSDHPRGAELHHAWQTSTTAWADGGLAEELLCAYDDRVVARPPEGPASRLLAEAGQAALRTGWDRGATYLLMQAEHGKTYGLARSRAGKNLDGTAGHNHADPLSFILHAYGETLALDAGYLGWENHDKVKDPPRHNLILVDGQGPRPPYLSVPPVDFIDGGIVLLDPDRVGGWVAGGDGEAWLVEGGDAGDLKWARAWTEYRAYVSEPVTLRRDAVMLGGRAVALLDDAQCASEHAFTWLLHGNAGGTSGGSFERRDGEGGVWRRPRAVMAAAFASPTSTPTFEDALDVHDAGGWVEKKHVVLKATVRGVGAKAATLLTLTRAGEADAALSALTQGAGRFARFADGSTTLAARGPQIAWEGGEAEADGLAWFAAPGQPPSAVHAEAATRVRFGTGSAFLESARGARLALGRDGDTWRGQIASAGTTLRIPGTIARSTGACVLTTEGTHTRIEIPAGRRALSFTLGPARVAAAPVAVLTAPASAFDDEAVALDASASCDADADALTHTWTHIAGPPGARIEGTGARVTLRGAAGEHRVAVVVSDGTSSDRAEASVRIEARPIVEPPITPPKSGGCSAAETSSAAVSLLLAFSLLLVLRRRRASGA